MSTGDTPTAMASLSERVAEEIRVALTRRRMRQSQLARELGVSEQWISVRLRGVQPIDLNDLDRIAKALGVSVQSLLPDEVGIKSPNNAHVGQTSDRPNGHRPHVVDVRSPRGSVATTIRRPQRRAAQVNGSRLVAAAGMVTR